MWNSSKSPRFNSCGQVRDINGKVLDKPGQQVLIGSEFFIDSEPMFVSRGGEKLLEAFKKLEIKVKDKICIDAGISTGGFTDCLLPVSYTHLTLPTTTPV